MLRITNFRIPLETDTPLERLAAKRLKVPAAVIEEVKIVRKAIDARRKHAIQFVYSLDVKVNTPEGQVLSRLTGDKDVILSVSKPLEPINPGKTELTDRPVVIGAGPAGLLAAYTLAKYGYRPVLLERGRDVDQRTQDIASFWRSGSLDLLSNVQFGEGGAGTFSDGKLTTRVNDPAIDSILDLFVEAGASPEIKYLHKPHIGTDKLRLMVKNLRQLIISLGGEVQFESQLTDIDISNGAVRGVVINENRYIPCQVLLLAIGHSARDTYTMLHKKTVAMQPKAFAVGVRIEHPQELIDKAQYGQMAGHSKLPPADYALVYHDKTTGRSAYSFCMCPGGLVVAAASEQGRVVTNGMSLFKRDSGIANSALVVNVTPNDFGQGVLDGIEFQRKLEEKAFQLGGSNYYAPVQTVGDFLQESKGSRKFMTQPTYQPGVTPVDLHDCLPKYVTATLEKALPEFDKRVRGFAQPGAVLSAVETRTSAPLRICRGENYMSLNLKGLYPLGEGAGYAGGIMSAALDGMHGAAAVIEMYKPLT